MKKISKEIELIRTQHLTKIYGSGASAVHALEDINLRVERGEFLAIMGPSGCGKSTLLNMIGALDQPTSGEVWVSGKNLATLKDLDTFRAQTVGFVFQLHNLLPTLNAVENVEVPMVSQSWNRSQRRARAAELLELVDMADRLHHLPSQLSGGQRQRVAIARALANNPPLLLADEPTGALDSQSGEDLLELLASLNHTQETTIAVVTHDRRVAQATDRILYMHDGRVVDDHPIVNPAEEDLRLLSQSRFGQALFNQDGISEQLLNNEERATLRQILGRYNNACQT